MDPRSAWAAYALVGLVLLGTFWVLRNPPPDDGGCERPIPRGRQAAADAYLSHAVALHALGAAVVLGVLLALSARRRGGRPGTPTAVAAGCAVAVAVASSVSDDVLAYGLLLALGVVLLCAVVVPLAALVAPAVAEARGVELPPLLVTSGAGWLVLAVVALDLALVEFRGSGPLCL